MPFSATQTPQMLALLAGGAFVAGFVNSIAGGGGLITVPLLMATGLPPSLALGTNKGQAVFGAATSVYGFAKPGELDRPRVLGALLGAGTGGLVGVFLQSLVSNKYLQPACIVLLLLALGLFLLPRKESKAAAPSEAPIEAAPSSQHEAVRRRDTGLVARRKTGHGLVARRKTGHGLVARRKTGHGLIAFAFCLGTYDGFFGPGTGTLLAIGYERLFGDDLLRASGNAKVANFASNVTAFAFAVLRRTIVWKIALPMALASILGSWAGARVAVVSGKRVVRGAIVVAVLALVAKLAFG